MNKQINIQLFPEMSDTKSVIKDLNKQLLNVIRQKDKYDDASRFSIVSKLLNDGADPNMTIFNSLTILRSAIMSDFTDIVKLLLDNNADPNLLLGADIGSDNDNSLTTACRFGNIKIIEMLLNSGVDVNHANKYGSTALSIASRNNHIETVKLLLLNGVNLNITNFYGSNPLMIAIENNNIEIAEILLLNGTDLNFTCRYGWTALLLATIDITEQKYELIKNLVFNGANINIMNSRGETPLLKAMESKHEECIEYLCSKMIEEGTLINELPEEIYSFPNVIRKLYWRQRNSYINFMEGCSNDNSHVTKYLFNNLVCREICELI